METTVTTLQFSTVFSTMQTYGLISSCNIDHMYIVFGQLEKGDRWENVSGKDKGVDLNLSYLKTRTV